MRVATPAFVLVAALALLYSVSAGPAQDRLSGAQGKAKLDGIEGDWSLVSTGGTLFYFNFYNRQSPVTHAYVTNFSGGKIKGGFPTDEENKLNPRWKWFLETYKLDPGGEKGAVDVVDLGRDGDLYEKPIPSKGIYLVKDDWLFMCADPKDRPRGFTGTVSVSRRGVLPPLSEETMAMEDFLRLSRMYGEAEPGPAEDKAPRGLIEGKWYEFLREAGGAPRFALPEKRRDGKDAKFPHDYARRVWKFSDATIEKGIDDGTFPNKGDRWRCKFETKAKPPTIDAILIDKNGKEYPEHQWKAIYEVIDHHLLICVNSSDPPVRPEKFTTSEKSAGTTLYLLRRAK